MSLLSSATGFSINIDNQEWSLKTHEPAYWLKISEPHSSATTNRTDGRNGVTLHRGNIRSWTWLYYGEGSLWTAKIAEEAPEAK